MIRHRLFACLSTASFIAVTTAAFAQVAAPARPAKPAAPVKPAPTTAQAATTARRTDLEAKLKSNNKDQIVQAFAGYKAWFAEDAKAGENAFWTSRPIIMPLADYATNTLELIDLAKKYKFEANSAKYGYLFALQYESFMQLGKTDEALAAAKEGLDRDPAATVDEFRLTLVPAIGPLKKNKEIAEIFGMCVAACPDTPAITESLLKQRITTFNAMKDYTSALACAKSYFNVATMATTSDAITIMDRQFLLPNMDDRSKVDQFRREQTTAAAPTSPGQPARTSPLVQGIKVDSTLYEQALTKMSDDSLTHIITHV